MKRQTFYAFYQFDVNKNGELVGELAAAMLLFV